MAEPTLIQEQRKFLRAFREATAQRNKTEAQAEATQKKAQATRTQAEVEAKKQIEQQQRTVEKGLRQHQSTRTNAENKAKKDQEAGKRSADLTLNKVREQAKEKLDETKKTEREAKDSLREVGLQQLASSKTSDPQSSSFGTPLSKLDSSSTSASLARYDVKESVRELKEFRKKRAKYLSFAFTTGTYFTVSGLILVLYVFFHFIEFPSDSFLQDFPEPFGSIFTEKEPVEMFLFGLIFLRYLPGLLVYALFKKPWATFWSHCSFGILSLSIVFYIIHSDQFFRVIQRHGFVGVVLMIEGTIMVWWLNKEDTANSIALIRYLVVAAVLPLSAYYSMVIFSSWGRMREEFIMLLIYNLCAVVLGCILIVIIASLVERIKARF